MKRGREYVIASKICIAIVASFLLLEQATRFYLFGADSFNYFKVNSVHSIGISGLIKSADHRELIYELRPRLDTYFKMARFKTNSLGLRDKEYAIKKPHGTFRVAVIGDSYTMPAGVEIEDAFHTRLETRLNAESSESSYEFINFGVGGYDPRQYAAVLKLKALRFAPDLVLVCFSVPFKYMNSGVHYQRLYKVKPKSYPFFHSFAIDMGVNREDRIKRRWMSLFAENPLEEEKNVKGRLPEAEKQTDRILSQLRNIGEMQNVPICIIMLQHYYDGASKSIHRLRELVATHELHFVDTSVAFENTDFMDYAIYKIDLHPNAEANRFFADVIYGYLKNEKLI